MRYCWSYCAGQYRSEVSMIVTVLLLCAAVAATSSPIPLHDDNILGDMKCRLQSDELMQKEEARGCVISSGISGRPVDPLLLWNNI